MRFGKLVKGKRIIVVSQGAPIQGFRFLQHDMAPESYPLLMKEIGHIRNCHIFHYSEKKDDGVKMPLYGFERSTFLTLLDRENQENEMPPMKTWWRFLYKKTLKKNNIVVHDKINHQFNNMLPDGTYQIRIDVLYPSGANGQDFAYSGYFTTANSPASQPAVLPSITHYPQLGYSLDDSGGQRKWKLSNRYNPVE